MALTLGALMLPQGLRWADEFGWTPVAQVTEHSLLKALMDAGTEMTLTLHDARTFTVLPSGNESLTVTALPIIKESGPANLSSGARYVLEKLTLIEV